MIAIVTETLSCLTDADCTTYGVSLAPLDCVEGELVRTDRIISAEEPISEDGYTVPPTEEAYRARFETLLREHDAILCITASRKFSESNRNATLAALPFGGRVVVIDSASVAGGLLLLVLRARSLINFGYPMSRIKAELEAYKNNLRVSFTANSERALENAQRLSYRLPVGHAALARHPIFRIESGGIGVSTYADEGERSARALLSVFESEPDAPRRPPSHIVVHYADRTPTVEALIRRIRALYPSATLYERLITLSLQLNLGHDIVGVVGD